jgi:Cu2+-exporting ATPase
VRPEQTIAASTPLLVDEPGRDGLIQCRLLHVSDGRVRLHADPADLFGDLGPAFEAFLREQSGVEDVRLNPGCQSVVLRYDPTLLAPEGAVALAHGLPLGRLDDYRPRNGNGQAHLGDTSAWRYLGLSTAAVVADLMFESAFTPWLLAGAAIPIFVRAFESLSEKGKLNVDVLDAAATALLTVQGQFRTAGVMIWLVSLGDVIRDLTLQQSHRAIEGLFEANIQYAWVVRDEKKIRVKVEEIDEGDEVVVYPGELITVDGTVLKGRAAVDQKILTGESMPVEKGEGDEVFAATVVRDGKLYLKASKVGEETMVANVVNLIRHAPVRETRVQNYAEHFADRLVPWSFLAAGAAAAATGSVNGAAALLIVDYGTGIRVSAPTTVLAAMTKAARHGVLIKGGRHLEQLAAVDTIVFDKTGTLTIGVPEVVEIIPYGRGVGPTHVLTVAAAAEERLTHPMAQAIVRAARMRGIEVPERETSDYAIGLGVEATVSGMSVLVGCHRFMASQGITMRRAQWDLRRIDDAAASPIFVAVDGDLLGILVCSDPLRPEAPEVVRALRERGVKEIVMLTGDHPAVAKTAAEALGITRYIADAFPEQKSDFVQSLQQRGATVAVVGDGINDSPALARADVGIAVHGGTDVARETAHVAVLEGNLWKIPQAIDIAREAMGLIRQNWDLVFYPNTVAIAASLAGLIGPVGATLLSNGAAVISALNGLRPLLGGRPGSDERGDEVLDGELGRGAEDDRPEPVAGRAKRSGRRLRLPQVAPAP